MLHVNFNTYNNYVTDSLRQWDINQDLVINGLGLSAAPEIHFANANMDRAIVRQSTLDSGVITVRIPNSLLQAPLTIKAYVGVYEGETFKVIETIEIPVIAKAKPADYVIEDSDEEIYSFNALENRINYIIAHNNDTDGNTELLDIRVDCNGNVHASAGAAVRSQIDEINKNKVDKSSIVQTVGESTDKIMSQKVVTKITDELRSNLDALNRGGLNLKDDVIAEQVTEWLDDHPEATTTVPDKSLTIDKMVVGTLGYVTPEMFGAKGDGVTDDTEAIEAAFGVGKPVLLGEEYSVETITVPMGTEIIVNGTLTVKGTINICYPSIKFIGTGTIKCNGSVGFTLKGAGNTYTTYCKNFYIADSLTVAGVANADNTAFLITADIGTNGIVVYPEINCYIHTFKYGIRSSYAVNDKAWFTSLRCKSLFENCQYALILDWQGGGTVFDGVIQPVLSSANPHTDEIPLVKVNDHCTVKGMIWDIGTAANKYAIIATGKNNIIDVPIAQGYILLYDVITNNVTRFGNTFSGSTPFQNGNNITPVDMPFDNTNDLAINAGKNKVSLTATPAMYKNMFSELSTGKRLNIYASNSTAPDGLTLEYDFPEAVALREVFVSGQPLPDSVKFEIKLTDGTWVTAKECYKDIDYINENGRDNYAWWQYEYDYYGGFELGEKNITGVRITMIISNPVLISRVYIGACNINVPSRMGDDLIATTLKIKGTDGKYYNVSVVNGALTVAAES